MTHRSPRTLALPNTKSQTSTPVPTIATATNTVAKIGPADIRCTLVHALAGSARAHAFHEFSRKLTLCRGPGSNRRHMVLQTIALPTELPRRDPHSISYSASKWNGLTRRGVSNHVRP